MSHQYSESESVQTNENGCVDTSRFSVTFVVVWGIVFSYIQVPVLMALTGEPAGGVIGLALVFGFLSSGGIESIKYFSDR